MVRCVTSFVRLALASAALVAQVSVPALGRDCERACAATVAHECCSAAVASAAACCPHDAGTAVVESGGGCYNDGDHAGNPGGTSDEPCRCRLEPRQEDSLPGQKQASPRLSGAAALPGTALVPPPATTDVSREYLAASLSIPIRPARILFGVWRN